jgi:hypothetical protein
MIAAHGALPFFCHHAQSGEEYDWRSKGTTGPLQLQPAQRKVCEGWKRAVAHLRAKHGFTFGATTQEDITLLRIYQKRLASDAIRQLDIWLDAPLETKESEHGRLQDLVRAVCGMP